MGEAGHGKLHTKMKSGAQQWRGSLIDWRRMRMYVLYFLLLVGMGRAGTGPGGERGVWLTRALQSIVIV